jgi:hypothetical protein
MLRESSDPKLEKDSKNDERNCPPPWPLRFKEKLFD